MTVEFSRWGIDRKGRRIFLFVVFASDLLLRHGPVIVYVRGLYYELLLTY